MWTIISDLLGALSDLVLSSPSQFLAFLWWPTINFVVLLQGFIHSLGSKLNYNFGYTTIIEISMDFKFP